MRKSRWWVGATLLAMTLLPWSPALQADTTVVDVRLGATFTGTIGTAGVDTVEAHFQVAEGAAVKITVQAARGSTLQPTIAIRDASGTPITSGTTQRIRILPVGNLIHVFTPPASGAYVAEIGGSSGSGGFVAKITGRAFTVSMVSLSGTVTNALTGDPVEGVSVYAGTSLLAITDASGHYSGDLAPGSYTISFEADGFEALDQPIELSSGTPAVLDVDLVPTVAVTVDASVTGDSVPGGVLTGAVEIVAPPGTDIQSITWTQESGAPANISGAGTATPTITLASASGYKEELIQLLTEPPVTQEDLPPNVPLPAEGSFGGLQDRFEVVGINSLALEEMAAAVLRVEVVTDRGTFSDEVEIDAALPSWITTTGLRNVPQGVPVLLHGKEQASYDWVLTAPPGSSAVLMDAASRNPYFTPDIPGLYELEVTDEAAGTPQTLEIYAGTWRGTIVGEDMDGRPVPDTACTFCHNGTLAPDKFTPWAQSGHAEIFTDNLDTSSHYSTSCFTCHMVGFDSAAENGGADEAPDYTDFLNAGLLSNPNPDNWSMVLSDFPDTARLANIQCENCHGPQNSLAHGFAGPLDEPRVSLSADVCGSCHGEPLRHGRFQQWQLSGHANYELAISEGESGSCARCHTANGFLEWVPVLLGEVPGDPEDDVTVTWTEDETHPQTCAACHNPHAEGTTTGVGSNATVRISGDTPPLLAGFQAMDVGRGALCMTCHNSRRGLRNDDVFESLSTSDKSRAPHGPTQADVLMGQNGYFEEPGSRGGHSFIDDTCVRCHMEATPPPDILSYQQGGTNHTFFADKRICSDCHSSYLRAEDVQDAIQSLLDQVEQRLGDAFLSLMGELIDSGYTIDLNGDATITDVSDVTAIEFGDSHGRQAITVTLMGGDPLGPYAVTDVDVRDASLASVGTLYDFADPALPKAGWNWILFHNDGSLGVHNPFFASDTLIASRDALLAVTTLPVSFSGEAPVLPEAPPPATEPVREKRQLLREHRER